MSETKPSGVRQTVLQRWGAASGLLALAVAAVAVAFERSTPNPNPSPNEIVTFYADHHAALLAQSLLFVLSSGIFLWFIGSLRAYLANAEGRSAPVSSAAYAAGVAWIVLNLAVQAPQIALARAARGGLQPQATAVVNDLGLALATIADVPVAVLIIAVAVLSLRANAFPGWLGWLSVVAAAVHLVAWCGIVVDSGPLAPGGWATFVVYPVFVVWLVAVSTVMIIRTVPYSAAQLAVGAEVDPHLRCPAGKAYAWTRSQAGVNRWTRPAGVEPWRGTICRSTAPAGRGHRHTGLGRCNTQSTAHSQRAPRKCATRHCGHPKTTISRHLVH